jgi:copper chaperone
MCKQKLAVRLILIVFVMIALSCGGSKNKVIKPDIKQEPVAIEVSIGGMFCTDCEQTIQKRVGELEGIKSVKASYTAGNAIIEFFPEKTDTVKIREAITGSGYAVKKFIVP